MKKSYSNEKSLKGDKRSLLEEILEKNRRKLSRQLLRSSLQGGKTRKSTKSPQKSPQSTRKSPRKSPQSISSTNKFSQVNTILKSIAFRKKQKSLPILLNYILKNTEEIYNELGEEISQTKIDIEAKRFNLMLDSDNKKHYKAMILGKNGFNLMLDSDNKKPYAKNSQADSLKYRQIWHTIFSLPNNKAENKAKLLKLAESLENIFTGYKYVYGIHTNTNNMHLHLALKCQNDITKKRLRVGGKDLVAMNKYLYEQCRELEIDLEATNKKVKEKPVVNKQFHKLPDFMKKTVPLFCQKYESNSFEYISTNTATLNSLKKLKMKEADIQKFLWLYHENKQQAIYSINNSPKIFGLNSHRIAEYKTQNNGKGFSLRKVEIILKSKEKEVLIEI